MCDFRKNAFERAINVYERQCLWLGLICIILEIAFERANDVYVKQCL